MNRSQSPMTKSKRYVSPSERKDEQQQLQKVSKNYQGGSKQGENSQIDSFSILGRDDNQSKISNMTQFANYMFIPCPSHPDLFITNICQDQMCIEPLCPECITTHLEMHAQKGKTPKLDNIQRVRKEQCAQIDELVKKLAQKSRDTSKYFKDLPQQRYQETLQQLQQIHQQVLSTIDQYFNELYQELKVQTMEKQKQELIQIDQEISQKIKHLIQFQEGLHSEAFVKNIIQICEQKQNILNDNLVYKLDKSIQEFESNLTKVVFEQRNLEVLSNYLKKCCYFVKSGYQPKPLQANNSLSKAEFFKDMPPVVKPNQFIADVLTDQPKELEIYSPDHFDPDIDPVLVRLDEDSQTVYTYSIYNSELKKEVLTTNNRTPSAFKLLITHQGEYLLIGGIYKDKQRFKSSPSVLEFKLKTLSLQQHSEMVLPRALTSAIQVDDYVYVVGGSQSNDENSSIAKAEKLNLNTRKWTSISDPQYKCSGCALISLGKSIIKIGGKSDIFTPCNQIELYNISNDSWQNVDFKFQSQSYLRLPYQSIGLNIGNNQILIMGGSVHDVKVDETQIFNLNDKTIRKSIQLPIPMEYNTTQGIIYKNQIYAISEEEPFVIVGNSYGFKKY